MGPLALLQLFGPILGGLIPQIGAIIKPGTEVSQRNVELAQLAVDTITKAAGTPNLQAAVEKMQSPAEGPATVAAVKAAIVAEPTIRETLEIGGGGGGIEAARMANAPYAPRPEDPWYVLIVRTLFNPVLIISAGLLPLIYKIVWDLAPFFDKLSPDAVNGAISTIIGLALGGIAGFWLGQTYQQRHERAADTKVAAE